MHFTAETSSNGVVERNFTLGEVTGLLWSPASGSGRVPLVLMAHSGGQHKRAPGILGRAHRFVTDGGFNVAAIDAPGHGDRPRTVEDEQHIAVLRQAQAAREPLGPVVVGIHIDLAARTVPEWQATLDALQELPEIGADGPIGFWGIMQGTGIGVPLTAVEPRITAAVFGCLGHESLTEAAAQITVPIEFLLQWDDEQVERAGCNGLLSGFWYQAASCLVSS
jgi:pimeloyl-ACP methyl ester carboxylesterase